jgi:hypothetical protein
VERFSRRTLDRALELAPFGSVPRVSGAARVKLSRAIGALMVMSPEFRHDTAKLFFTMHGYSRDIRRVLAGDPLAQIAADADIGARLARLVEILNADVTAQRASTRRGR